MKRVLGFAKKYWHFALLAPLCMLGEVCMDLIQPRLMSKIVDDGVLTGNVKFIISTGLIMLLCAVIGGLAGMLSGLFANLTSQNFGNDLRKAVYKRVMSLSFEQTDKFTTGSLITRLTNDINASQEFVSIIIRMFIRSGFTFIGSIFMVLSLNVNFGIVIACALPVQLIIVIVFLKKVSPYFSQVQKKLDNVNSVVQENVTGARVVKAYVREDYETDRFKFANNELMQVSLKVMKLMATIQPALMIIMNVTIVFIIFIGGKQIEARSIGVGDVMAAITYATNIIMSMMMVSMTFQHMSRAKASLDRIGEVLDTLPVISGGNEKTSKNDGEVEFKNVSFAYPSASKRAVLDGINLTIKKGETVAVLGATGSGKTSLVNLIPRFYDVTNGELFVDGMNVKYYDLKDLREKISIVLQKSELYSGTVADNIRWGNEDASMEEIIEAAKIAQADDFISSFVDGYDTVISEKGSSLSGGQKQRISIARAILKKPKLLIFDDSTSALDLATESRLQNAIRNQMKGTTAIMIAQRVASVINADKIVVIENGGIVAEGTHEELLKSSDVYKDIYSSQMKEED